MDSSSDLFDGVETARLRLRCVRPDDAARISEMMTPSVSRWVTSWPVPFTLDMTAERIASMRQAVTEGRALSFSLERLSDEALLGWIAVMRNRAEDRRAMLGYWMGEAYQGHGYMREAAPAAVKSAFRLFGLDVIEAAAQPENVASFAVLRGYGMALTGERTVFVPARGRDELCLVYEVARMDVELSKAWRARSTAASSQSGLQRDGTAELGEAAFDVGRIGHPDLSVQTVDHAVGLRAIAPLPRSESDMRCRSRLPGTERKVAGQNQSS